MPLAGIVVILPLKQKNQLKMLNFLKIFTIFAPSVEKTGDIKTPSCGFAKMNNYSSIKSNNML